jgi:hypothetical protein
MQPGSSRKDRNITFYRGQLIHYGVQASGDLKTKTKKDIKQRLLAAFESSGKMLKIPTNIQQVEAQLREEYEPTWEVGEFRIVE